MTPATWESLAIQIPVVLVFSAIVYVIIKMFLAHIEESDRRTQAFLDIQQKKSDATIAVLTESHKQSLQRITDSLCAKLNITEQSISQLRIEMAGHDAFVQSTIKNHISAEEAYKASKEANNEIMRVKNEELSKQNRIPGQER